MNITTNIASDEPNNQSREQVPGPSAQSKSQFTFLASENSPLEIWMV